MLVARDDRIEQGSNRLEVDIRTTASVAAPEHPEHRWATVAHVGRIERINEGG